MEMIIALSYFVSGHSCRDPEHLPISTSDTVLSSLTGFFRIPPRHPSVLRLHHVPDRYYDVKRTRIHGENFNCSDSQQISEDDTRLNCPIDIIINHDQNRIPNILLETLCGCSKCIDRTDVSFSSRIARSCAITTEYVMVYRRIRCVFKRFVYRRVWEPVRSGCPCSTPRGRVAAQPGFTPKAVGRRHSASKRYVMNRLLHVSF